MLNLSDEKRSTAVADGCGPFLIGVHLALVKSDCQVVGGDSGVRPLTP
jgi:hypothetical protein